MKELNLPFFKRNRYDEVNTREISKDEKQRLINRVDKFLRQQTRKHTEDEGSIIQMADIYSEGITLFKYPSTEYTEPPRNVRFLSANIATIVSSPSKRS